MDWTSLFRKKHENIEIPERIIDPQYILDPGHRADYVKYGYVIIRDLVDDATIEQVLDMHDRISKMPGYFESDKLQTSIAFGQEIHNIVIELIQSVSTGIFNKILDESLCEYDFGGGIIIKNKGCWFAPHQDCSIIDEYQGTTTYAWIPTVDMNERNGTFYAIPGSHLWAAWQRSSQHPGWPLIRYSDFLWKNMLPLYLNKGDVLLFDSALIHASGSNDTNKKRIAFNACIIERKAQHVQYVKEKNTPRGKIEKYLVDKAYWYKGDLSGRPKGYAREVEAVRYPSRIDERLLQELIWKFSPENYQKD